mmetsp:Transcript_17094/g.36921  ORF Transcript_17094/g.36921 Transcript_17094/m.36921 type:complete len:89 (-) Transcript_17094:62-328(-)
MWAPDVMRVIDCTATQHLGHFLCATLTLAVLQHRAAAQEGNNHIPRAFIIAMARMCILAAEYNPIPQSSLISPSTIHMSRSVHTALSS